MAYKAVIFFVIDDILFTVTQIQPYLLILLFNVSDDIEHHGTLQISPFSLSSSWRCPDPPE